ncbi:hypothetical protein FRB97_000577 [Tulasnella sp. 331]|nr:hypothetical protein FRB97_000577 [Tulasnella sp. 331]
MTELGPNADMSQDYPEDALRASLMTEYRSLSFLAGDVYRRSQTAPLSASPTLVSTPDTSAEITPEPLQSTPSPTSYISYAPAKSYSRPVTRRARQPPNDYPFQVGESSKGSKSMMEVYRKRKLQLLLQRKDVNFLVDAAASLSLEEDVEEVRKRSRVRARERLEYDSLSPSKAPLSTIVDCPMEEEEEEEDDRRKRKIPATIASTSENFVTVSSSTSSDKTKAEWYCITLGPIVRDASLASYRHATTSLSPRPIVPLRRKVQRPTITLATITEEEPEVADPVETCSSKLTSMKLSDRLFSPTSSAEPYMLQLVG